MVFIMVEIDERIRGLLEKRIDEILKQPKSFFDIYTEFLEAVGIEPNLETILSLEMGYIYGVINGAYNMIHNRTMTQEEFSELTRILNLRAYEIRIAIIKARSQEKFMP
jgi:hypothetical protein